MSVTYYPAMLHLENRRVLFIGGGWETELKVRGLLDAGAVITVLSQHEHAGLEELVRDGRIVWHRRAFQAGDTAGFWLVMSHPVDKADNAVVYAEAEANGILCNCVDDPERCSFILPSVLRRGDLVISVSTSGTAPALGVRIKQKFAQEFGPEYAEFLRLLRELRPGITGGFSEFETRKHLWYAMMDSGALELMRQNQPDAARTELERVIADRRAACRIERCVGCANKACAAHLEQAPLETRLTEVSS
jgi:precorrin-2 dehydrogenase / sirohydrochlorin ferrochelatase